MILSVHVFLADLQPTMYFCTETQTHRRAGMAHACVMCGSVYVMLAAGYHAMAFSAKAVWPVLACRNLSDILLDTLTQVAIVNQHNYSFNSREACLNTADTDGTEAAYTSSFRGIEQQ